MNRNNLIPPGRVTKGGGYKPPRADRVDPYFQAISPEEATADFLSDHNANKAEQLKKRMGRRLATDPALGAPPQIIFDPAFQAEVAQSYPNLISDAFPATDGDFELLEEEARKRGYK